MKTKLITLITLLCLALATAVGAQAGNTVNGLAWGDLNNNGLQDNGESGLSGLTVLLLDDTGGPIAQTTTAGDGSYQFTDLADGTYAVAFTPPANTVTSPQDINSNSQDAQDSDVNAEGVSSMFTLTTTGGGPAPDSSTTTVTPQRINDYLYNPGIGWQEMEYLGDDILSETVLYAERYKIAWRFLNPAEGVYDWSELDKEYYRAINNGKMFSFRVYTMRGEGYGGHQMPEWVVNKGARVFGNGENTEPDYSNCTYQEEWARFVEALRQRYEGDPNVSYIDISGYGGFNEWNWNNQTAWDDSIMNPASVDGQARIRLADMFIGGSRDGHTCLDRNGNERTVSYSYPGFTETQLVMPYAGIRRISEYVFERRSDVGFRNDCLGGPGYYDNVWGRFSDQLSTLHRTAPVIYEMCPNTRGQINYPESNQLLQLTHGSLVHDNGFDRVRSQITDLMRYAGYRYVLSSASYPAQVAPGNSLNVAQVWENVGYSPNYPLMHQNFQLRTYLTDGSQIISEANSNANIASWMPAADVPNGNPPDNNTTEALTVPAGTPTGTYQVRVAIIDQRTGAPINLGIAGQDSLGLYEVGTVEVTNGGGGSPVPQTVSVDAGFYEVIPASIDVSVSNVNIAEGETSSFTLTLGSQPTANVRVNMSIGEGATLDKNRVTFRTDNWETPRTVIISGTDDDNVDGSQSAALTFNVSSNDDRYSGYSLSPISVNVTDNDTATQISVDNTEVSVDEMGTITNTGTISGSNSASAVLNTNIGTVVNNGNGTWNWTHMPTDGPSADVVEITTDGNTVSFLLATNNIAPSASINVSKTQLTAGESATLSLTSINEVSPDDLLAGFSFTYDCNGDGTPEAANVPADSFLCVYPNAGQFNASASLADKDGGFNAYTVLVNVEAQVEPTATPLPPTSVPPTGVPPTSIPPTTIAPTPTDEFQPSPPLPPTQTPPPPTYNASLDSFVVFSAEDTRLQADTQVNTGYIGSNVYTAFARNSRMTNTSSAAYADTVQLNSSAQVSNVYANNVNGNEGAIQGNRESVTLPVIAEMPNMPDLNPNGQEIIVAKNGGAMLEAGSYGRLKVNRGGSLILTGGIYHFTEWDIIANAEIFAAAPVDIRVNGRLRTRNGVTIMPTASSGLTAKDIRIFINGNNEGDTRDGRPYAAHFGNDNTLAINIYAPNGSVKLGQRNTATGAYIGRWAQVGKNSTLSLDSGFGDAPPETMPEPVDPPTTPEPTTVPGDPQPTTVPPTQIPPTTLPGDPQPTTVPPTQVPPTTVPPTQVPPTQVPPTAVPDDTDSDWDGVPDSIDLCPNDWGHESGQGCNDDDGDGIRNSDDVCPWKANHSPIGNPCETDDDFDDVPDERDMCPNEWGDNAEGCPSWKEDD